MNTFSKDRNKTSSPIHWFKGRGAVANPQGRFERLTRSSDAEFNPFDFDEDLAESPRTEVRTEYARSIISRNQSEDIFFEQSINPYRGCEHGCIYCYARPQHSFVGLSPGQDFETILFAKVNAVELLHRELDASGYSCSPINIGSVTDAYQPIEKKWKLTRGLVDALAKRQHPFTIITKSSLVERDIDILQSLAERHLGLKPLSYEEVAGKGATQIGFEQVSIQRATEYAAEAADVTLQLHRALVPAIEGF